MAEPIFSVKSPTIAVSPTTSPTTSVNLPQVGHSIRIVNEGPNNAYVSIGVGTQTAAVPSATPSVSATVVLASTDNTFSLSGDTTSVQQISAICSTGTAVLRVQVGEGE